MKITEKIWILKTKIADIRSYVSSDLCKQPGKEYKFIAQYEKEIENLRKKLEEGQDECS